MSTSHRQPAIAVAKARRVVEALRMGIPPDGYVRHFTVGRETEIGSLQDRLNKAKPGALLLRANYGSGKTHLLRYVHESALEAGYAVSFVELDAKSAVRFNKMDQILGAIWRGLEIPNLPGRRGPAPFLNFVCASFSKATSANSPGTLWGKLADDLRWHRSSTLESPGMFVAIRAWLQGDPALFLRVVNWLSQPALIGPQRTLVHQLLVGPRKLYYVDVQGRMNNISAKASDFHGDGYVQAWAAIRDMDRLARAAGLKGLVLLFDEFEDIIYNLAGITYQTAAFDNLFHFYQGKLFPGISFFAVTPDFVAKCKDLLIRKQITHFDTKLFDKLTTFEMSPLKEDQLKILAVKVLQMHSIAYGWKAQAALNASKLVALIHESARARVEDRTRHAIKMTVMALDELFQSQE